MTLDSEASQLADKSAWAERTAQFIRQNRGIDFKTALAGCRWASLWIDEFSARFEQKPPVSREEVKGLLHATREDALSRSEGVPRYPSGVPCLQSLISVTDAFCIAYGDEQVRELLP